MTVEELVKTLDKTIVFRVYGNEHKLLFDSSGEKGTWEEIKMKAVTKIICPNENTIYILAISKKCANPKCDKYFDVRITNQKKKYCCARCATMVAKREYRKRKRKVQKAPPVGKDS